MAQDLREQLYRNLINSDKVTDKEIGSLDDFRGAISDEASSRQFYKNLINSGAFDESELGSEDDFYGSIRNDFAKPVKQARPAQMQNPQAAALVQQQMPQGFGQLDFRQANQMGLGNGPVSWEQPQQEPQQEKPIDKAIRVTRGQGTEEENKQVQKRLGQRMDEAQYESETGKRLRQQVLNPEWEAPTVAKDDYGNVRHDDNGNIITGFTTDEDVASAHQQIVKEQADYDQRKIDLQEHERIAQQRIDELTRELESIDKEHARNFLEQEQNKTILDRFLEAFRMPTVNGLSPYSAYKMQHRTQDETTMLNNRRILEETMGSIEDAKRDMGLFKDDDAWYESAGKGLARAYGKAVDVATNPETWDFGASDMEKQFALLQAVVRSDNNMATEADKKLLNDFALSNFLHGNYDDKISGWTKAGLVTGESLPFMLEMFSNPAAGIGSKVSEQAFKYAIKKYGAKYVRDHVKSLAAKKIAAKVAGDLVGAHVMAGTTGSLRTIANAYERMRGDIKTGVDENGHIIYDGHEVGDTAFDAFSKAWRSTAIENWSEMAGEYLPFITGFFGKAVGKSVIGKAGREALKITGNIENVSLNKAQKFIYDLAANKGIGAFGKGLDDFLKRTQWHGVLGEYSEEVLGNLANAITIGDMTLDTAEGTGVFNLQQNIDTFNGVALMGGFTSALQTGSFGLDKYRNSVKRRDRQGEELFGLDWGRIKTAIDSSVDDSRELNNILTDLLGANVADKKQKEAILNYTSAVLQNKGAEMAHYQPRMESSRREEITTPQGKQYVVTSLDKNGETIDQRSFETEDEAMAFEAELKMNQQHQDYKDYLKMSGGLSYSESENLIDEFLGQEQTQWTSDEARAKFYAEVQDPSTTIGRQFQEFKLQKRMEKAQASQQAIAAFEEENGWTPGTVAWLAEQDPMQLDAEGLEMADQARTFLEGLAYPAGEVHVEHEQQVGADTAQAVVNNVISDEVPIDPNDNAGKDLYDNFVASEKAIEDLFERNEDLKEEYYRLVGMGLSQQEVISSLDSFRPEDVQVVIDNFNARARYASFMDEAANQIDNVAHLSRQRHTFRGTIDGVADLNNVHTISDGTNQYYLVSGNVTTDPATGRITGSTSGLIIGMDLDGSFVQLSEDDGYSVDPVNMSLDQFEEAERIRLQEQVTQVIDPNGAMQQPTEQQNGNVGGEASADNGTGANEPPTPEPVNPTQPVNPPSPAGGEVQPQQPSVAIDSVIDKDGIKRYENGILVDDAIADIQNDGFDVNEIADASIAEAQQAIDKIDKKQTKTRKDLMDKKKAQDVITYYNNVKARWAEMNQPAESEENVNVQPEEPIVPEKTVSSQSNLTVEEQKQQRIAEAKAKYGELFDDDFTKANDVYELVSMWIGRKRNLAWDDVNGKRGLQKELGWTRKIGGDTKFIETLLAKKGEGMGVDEFVHMVWESPENDVNGEKRFDTDAIKEALLDMIKSARSKSDIVDHALNTRIIAAEQALEAQQQMEQEMQEAGETIEDTIPVETDWPQMPFPPTMTDEESANDDFAKWFDKDGNYTYKSNDTERELSESSGLVYESEQGGLQEGIGESKSDNLQSRPPVSPSTEGNQSERRFDANREEETNIGPESGNTLDVGQRQAGRASEVQTPVGEEERGTAAEGANEPESQGSTGSAVDDYLQPRNAEEEQIIANVLAQLQQEIGDAVEDANKARTELEKARAKESERATDLFANDNALNQEGQLFDNSDMPVDNSVEGIERRTAPEREKLQEAVNQLNRLQSLEERNSRIRGALDNYRRQTSIDDVEKEIDQRHKDEYEKYITPLLGRSDEELQQMAKRKEDAVNGDLKQLEGDLEYSAIHNVLLQREYDRQHREVKLFIENTIDDNDVTFVDKLTLTEFDKLQRLIDEYGVDDSEGKIEDYVKRLRKKYPAVDTKEQPQTQSREDYIASHPLTEEQIMADTEATEDEKLNAIDFLNGEDSVISRFYYDQIYERSKKQPTENPIEAIEQAAQQFRQEQKKKQQGRHRDKNTGEWVNESEQKSQDQKDIDDALKEFNDFLDNAKGSNVLDKFMRKGIEGNDKAQANLLDAFTLTNEAQRMFLKDLLRLASKVGYAYIKSGVHDVQAWSKKMSDSIGAKLREVLGWDDNIIGEFVNEVWNQKYTVDGQRMRLSEHAERLKNGKGADTTVNVNKQEDNEAEKELSLQQEASEKPKTKDGWLKKMNEVFKELCKKYGVPDDPIILNQWGGRYGFDYRITKGYRLDQFEPYYEAYKKKLDEPVEPASDKQLAFIDRLAGEDEKEMLHSIKLNKISASYVITILKAAEDAVTNPMSTLEMFEEYSNELEKVAKLHGWEPKLQGDSAEFADKQEKEKALRDDLKQELLHGVSGDRTLKTMQDVKKLAEKHGLDMSMTDLQEIVEAVIVDMARNYANNSFLTERQKFDNIVALYQTQPTLSARDNDRINKQQYSTAAPMAYLMGLFTSKGKKVKSGLEPSAGNGMLTIGLPKEKMHVNDIDEMRLSNLAKQGFKEVTSQDGLQPFGEKQYDVVVTNPPFGNVTPKVYDGIYEISTLEHQMAINALESMKDDGRAAIIIGGNTDYNANGTIKGKDRVFLNYLYSHYNVVDVINMDGKTLYSRQGTGFPLRMILINGRKPYDKSSFAPVQSKARAEQVKTYEELYKRVNDDILSDNNKPAGVHDTESGKSNGADDNGNAGNVTQTGVRNVQPAGSSRQSQSGTQSGSVVQRGDSTPAGKAAQGKRGVADTQGSTNVGGGLFDVASRPDAAEPSGSTAQQAGEQRNEPGGNDVERPAAAADNSQRVGQRGAEPAQQPEQPAVKRGLGTEKVPYRKQSANPFTLQSLMPAEQADVVKKALEDLGDVDQFLVDELGYSSKEELHQALAAEQIDSVAMAIHQMNQGSAFIIGDQTGIGKGRQAAALIRYGVKKGGFPVFITVKKGLFSDMYRDLCDIGSPKLRPFIWSADDTEHSGNVTDKDGNVIYQTPNAKEQKRVVDYINKNGKLPPEYDYVLTTYDSFKSGTMDYEEGQKKERKFPKGKKASAVHFNGQAKRDALETLAQNSYVIMDESHNAGGEGSNVSNYLQYITTKAKGLTFLSATFAKRPGNMPIYSLKTAISKAGVKVGELIDAVKRGGATFQEIMSKALTEAGQMIRRERDMTGVTIDWKGIEDEAVIQKQREQYDTVIGLFNDIISFQRTYVDPIVNGMNDAAAEEQGEVDHTPGTRDMGINNTPFASRTYNMVQQVLLSLKAEEAAKRAIEHLKLGRKPVITVANTNEGAADEVAGADGESMEMPDLSVNLKKGLQGTMRITKKDAFGNTVNEMIPFERLGEEGQKRYAEIMDAIENASSGLSLSPIDVIKNELKKAGYKVGELTGRKAEFVYNEDGTVKRVKRQDTDKKKIAADFNNGKIDALILNRSAGTGISLHASSTFKDQRQRIMIVAQAQGDVNDEVQIRGRIDRTGQVLRGMYEYVVSQIPSEQRLLMMLKAKLRSLDANTTSSQKSKFNEMQVQDIINKYGDDIVIQYLAEHTDLAMKMCDPLKWGEGAETLAPETLISQAQKAQGDGATASKVLGRMALLTVKEQEKMLSEISDLYQAEIDRLNEMGENDLEITEMPLKAKTLKKNVWEAGVEPGGKNPFADNSYVEEVEMDVLKKPMKGSEVKAAQERLLGGKTWAEYRRTVLDKVGKWAEQKKAETTQTFTERAEKKANAEKEKYIKGAKKMQDKNGLSDAEIERNSKMQYDAIYKQEMEKLKPALEAVDKQEQVFFDAMELFSTDGVYALPTDIYDLSQLTFEPSFGKVIDIDIKEDNYSTNASTITFATLDGRRKITIPINGMVKQVNGEKRDIKPVIVQQTAQTRHGMFGSNVANMLKVLEQNPDNWDKLTSTATRKKGHIITGNLLKALTSLRKQAKGGKLISYTTDTGEIRQGILMSDNFDPGTLSSENPISSAKGELRRPGDKIESADGEVTVKKDGWGEWYQLKVPKSTRKGSKYYNDEVLLSLMEGQFSGSSAMVGDFKEGNLDAVLKRLDELGVTVASQKEDDSTNSDRRFDEDIEEAVTDTQKALQEKSVNLSTVEMETAPRSKEEAISRIPKEGKLFPNDDQGTDIKVTRRALRHGFRRGEDFEFQAVGAIDQIIKNAVKIGELPVDEDERGKTDSVSIFYAPVSIDGKIYSVRLTIKRYIDRKGVVLDDLAMYDMNLHNEKTDPSLTNVGTPNDELVSANESESGYKVKDLIYNSQKEDKDLVGINNRQTRFDENETSVTQSGDERKGKIAKHVEQLLDKLGTKDKTTVYHSFDELPDDMKAHIRERESHGKKVRGWYENGHIYLYLPHIDSEYAAEKTIWHETVAHHGLRQLIGAENLNKLLRQLWLEHRDGEMGKWVTERMQKNGWALNEAIEEYLAREAEKNPFSEPGLWQRLKWMLADVLHKMGFATDPTISDIQYLFWVSQNQLNENDPLTKAKQQAFLFNLERQAANTPYVNMNAERVEDIYNPDAEGAYDDGIRHSEETDEEVIERLEKEPKIKVYRAMQLIDGKLYPPMAAKQGGKLVNPIELGKWEKADEHPEMADENGKFKLDKGNGKSLKAAYNPYIHTSTTMLNDQFSEAQNRPNLVVVEVEVPESELTSGYRAEKAKDAVGKLEWKAGVIQGQLTGTREVILSRWDKPVRIVPTEEVAKSIADQIKGKVEVMPTNVVTPQQRAELEKLGVKFVETDNRGFIKEGENAGKSYSSVYGKKANRRFDEDIDDPLTYSAKQVYNERLNRVETVFTEAYQDAMVSLKTAQNAIAGDKDIPNSQNAYMAENLMHGKNKNEQDLFNAEYRDPLIQTINKIMNLTGMNWGDVDRYVYTKSGLERNREFYVRDWLEAERNKTIRKYEDLSPEEQDIYNRKAEVIETLFEDGDIETEEEKNKKLDQALQEAHKEYVDDVELRWERTKMDKYDELARRDISFHDYLYSLDKFIFDNIDGDYIPSEHDYSGFRAMFGDENGKYDEAAIMVDLEVTEDMIGDDNVEQLWNQINAATRYGLERYREAGMRSDEQIDRVERMFHFYVPMRGFKEDRGEDMYQYFTGKDKSKNYIGGLLKHAKGRGSEANFPISTIFAMTYKAISDCNQNLVNQKLYRLCQANPNDLIILSDSWAKLNEQTGEWEEVSPDIPDDASEEEVREATLAYEEEMKNLANEGKAKKIKGREHFDYKPMDKKKQNEHIVDVRINGQPRKMIVTGNPRMAQALNGQLRFENGKNVFSKWNSKIKNMMASLFTSYSPTFALRNMFRDWTHFRTMLGVREGNGYAKQASKYYRQSLFKMVGLFKKYREGTLDESNEMERDFKDFMDNGGITGFVQMQKVDDIQKQMEKLYKQQKEGKAIRLNNRLWDYTLGAIEALNEGIENNARFATYRASRHYAGRTKARSAYDAKEITVNFNRKGAGGKTAGFKSTNKMAQDAAKVFGITSQILGEGRIFFNATVQAIATTFKNFQNEDGSLNKPYIAKWIERYAMPPFLFGLALPLINKILEKALDGGDGDDDPYANLAEWARRKNLCIYIGNNNFITIPIGQELAAFLSLGDMLAGMTYAPELKPLDRSIDEEMVGIMNTFSPVDIDTKITKGGLKEDPVDEVIGRTFSVLAPLVAVQQNLGWTGRPIYREDVYQNDKYNPEYQMVYSGTNPVLVGASKLANDLSGGDDVTRGKVQVNPAIVQYLWEQYTGGPGKVFSNTISIGKDAKDVLTGNESEFNMRKVEGLKAFIQQGDERIQYYRTLAKYRKYKEEADELSDAVNGYKQSAAEDPTAAMRLEEITKGEDFVRMQIVKEAEKSLSKINKAANKAEGKERKELRQLYNQSVKEVVDMLDEVGKE